MYVNFVSRARTQITMKNYNLDNFDDVFIKTAKKVFINKDKWVMYGNVKSLNEEYNIKRLYVEGFTL